MDYNAKTTGQNILTLRKQQGMSMDELAQRMGITIATLGLIERGQLIVTAENRVRLTSIFGFNCLKNN